MALIFTLGATAIAWLALECVRDPKINFLPRDRRAEWVLFPSAVDAELHPIASLDATFRREFTLANRPRTAQLGVGGANRVELKINGASVDVGTSGGWREISMVDVLAFLRTGTNNIEARVFNDNGPPSFWLFFNADRVALRSDQTWEASFAGSAWRRAALASVPKFPGAGNPIARGETLRVLPRIWRMQAVSGGIALVISATCFWWAHRFQRAGELGPENLFAYDLLVACLLDSPDNKQAIDVARNALAVSPFIAELHRNLGLALAQEGDLVPAANQFAYALLLRPAWAEVNSDLRHALFFLAQSGSAHLREAAASVPDSPQMLNELAWVLATNSDSTLRSGADAVRLAEHGCAITGRKDPALVATLAAAYGELGRFPDAINTAEEARSLARSTGDANTATLSQKLLDSFRANRPYREEPIYK